MSDCITLNNAKEIREWKETHKPERKALKFFSLTELAGLKIEKPAETAAEGEKYYGVEHTFYSSKGDTLINGERVYSAKNAEEALQKYLFSPTTHRQGIGNHFVGFKLWDYSWYEPQDLRVFPLSGDHFY